MHSWRAKDDGDHRGLTYNQALAKEVAPCPMFTCPTSGPTAFFSAVAVYYGDVVLLEPKLLTMYDDVLPQIERALGESSVERPR